MQSLSRDGSAPFVTIFAADGTPLWWHKVPPFVQVYVDKYHARPTPWDVTSPADTPRMRRHWKACLAGVPQEGVAKTSAGTFRYHLHPLPKEFGQAAVMMIGRQIPNELVLLSNREGQVIRRLARGWTVQRIGRDLGIAKGTVEKHRENARKKTGLSNSELIRLALLGDL